MFLWRKVYLKSRGGFMIISRFYHLHKRILQSGTVKNLFGERVKKNMLEAKRAQKCLIMPDSKFKMFWNILVILLLLYTAIFVPFKIAFIETDGPVMKVFEALIDILFGVDIIVNFISVTENTKTGHYVFDHKQLAKKSYASL